MARWRATKQPLFLVGPLVILIISTVGWVRSAILGLDGVNFLGGMAHSVPLRFRNHITSWLLCEVIMVSPVFLPT